MASTNSSEHMKVLFVRGNEKLLDGLEEVGGQRVYGGAILSRNPKNNDKWLKVKSNDCIGDDDAHITVGAFFFFILQSKAFPNNHLGTDFHVYELMWTPSEISLFIDGINYGSLNSNLRESAMSAKIKSAVNWANNGPFDKEVKAIRASRVANQISSKLTLFILPNSTFYP